MIRIIFFLFFALCAAAFWKTASHMDQYPTPGMNMYVSGLCLFGSAVCLLIAILVLIWRPE